MQEKTQETFTCTQTPSVKRTGERVRTGSRSEVGRVNPGASFFEGELFAEVNINQNELWHEHVGA